MRRHSHISCWHGNLKFQTCIFLLPAPDLTHTNSGCHDSLNIFPLWGLLSHSSLPDSLDLVLLSVVLFNFFYWTVSPLFVSFYYFLVTSWKTFERTMLLDNKSIYIFSTSTFKIKDTGITLLSYTVWCIDVAHFTMSLSSGGKLLIVWHLGHDHKLFIFLKFVLQVIWIHTFSIESVTLL